MNISQRLRTCARHTGLDAVIELLNEAADEIDALQARAQVPDDPETVAVDHFDNAPSTEFTNRIYPPVKIGTKLYTAPQPAQATQPAEVTDEQIAACVKRASTYGLPFVGLLNPGGTPSDFSKRFTVEILALRPVQSGLTGCNCRWDGDTQVQWCELHLAHKEAIHEWAERAKEAEKQLDLPPVQVPMTCHCQTCRPITITDMRMVLCPKCGNKRCPHANDHRNACTGSNEPGQPGSAYPAHHGITAQAKKEDE